MERFRKRQINLSVKLNHMPTSATISETPAALTILTEEEKLLQSTVRRYARPEAALSPAAGRRHGRVLCALGGRLGLRRLRHGHARRRGWRPLPAHRPQALDHQRRRGWTLPAVRQRQPRGRLSRHHGFPY